MKKNNNWHEVDMRDNRYNQIIHLVSAARGAEAFYSVAGHKTRHESLGLARELDSITANVGLNLCHTLIKQIKLKKKKNHLKL